MSSYVYAKLTSTRDDSPAGESTTNSPPGIKQYIDIVAALVPTEVLTLHAVILSYTTDTSVDSNGASITTITAPTELVYSFWGMIILSVIFYLVPRWVKRDKFDFLRLFIPPAAFVIWTMLQKATAFDAVAPNVDDPARTIIAIFGAVVLGSLTVFLANKADNKPPNAGAPI